MEKKTSTFSNGLIWFGAAISIAEILTGTYIADMGVKDGLLTVFSGHLIGCVLLYLAGMIGAKTRKSAMETTKISFGKYGSYIFSILNVFTAFMSPIVPIEIISSTFTPVLSKRFAI